MTHYDHKQTGKLLFLFGGLGLTLLVLSTLSQPEEKVPLILSALLLLLVTFQFSSLRVTVDQSEISAAFGLGWPKKRIPHSRIQSARQVKNAWYVGWGIRKVPSGWMYNVSGLDAVELLLTNGRVFRIGTDEPEALLTALQRATGKNP